MVGGEAPTGEYGHVPSFYDGNQVDRTGGDPTTMSAPPPTQTVVATTTMTGTMMTVGDDRSIAAARALRCY